MLAVGFVVGISISGAYAILADDLICLKCVDGSDLAPNSVGTGKITDNSVKTSDLANKSVGSKKIKDNSVKSIDIKDGTITSADLGTLTDLNISGNIVSSGDICIGSCP